MVTNKAMARATQQPKGEFHNPYNFVTALPRQQDKLNNSGLGDAGDANIASHGKYHDHLWTGTIKVRLHTETPVLIPDAATAREEEDNRGHKYYDLRRTANNQPYLPPTEIKGMLRTAYEIVTNSRYSVFVEHQDRLAYRINAQGVDLVPARVEQQDDGLCLRLMEGKDIEIAGREQDLLGYAAKLPRYQQGVERSNRRQPRNRREDPALFPLKYKDGSLPQHGDLVWVRFNEAGGDNIRKSVVTRIRKYDDEDPKAPGKGNWFEGWVFVSNENILGKKYERVFIKQKNDETIPITSDITALWTELIKDYQKIHQKDLMQRDDCNQDYDEYLGNKPGDTAWSRHIYEPGAEQLNPGTLCYVQFNEDKEIIALFPVVLSRRLYKLSPEDLLAANLYPATKIEELSPAERVFGWVKNKSGKGEKAAYKGNLRIGAVECITDDSIKEFDNDGFPLAILGQPQPQQARFYVANNKRGKPLETRQNNNRTKKPGYDNENQGLRGRKVYPHHRLPDGHWDIPQTEAEQTANNNGHFKEWYRQGNGRDNRDNQNRSIKAWVKPDTTFEFNIDVTNLSDVELGALLWLLDLPAKHYHRLGGGKPFGFGSVRLELDRNSTDLRKGSDWKEYYRSLLPWGETNSEFTAQETIALYQQAVTAAYGSDRQFEQIDFIKAFCISAKGFEDNLPIHYPRIRQQDNNNEPVPPHSEGKGFEWFVENDRSNNPLSLPSLLDETGLPYN